MIQKKRAKKTRKHKISCVHKKSVCRQKQNTAQSKSPWYRVKQLKNYREFIKFLLAADPECDIADEAE